MEICLRAASPNLIIEYKRVQTHDIQIGNVSKIIEQKRAENPTW
jgi:hypothetical protein